MWRYVFMVGALFAMLFGVIDRDAVFAAAMGASFGFQLALWLVDREQTKGLRDAKKRAVR